MVMGGASWIPRMVERSSLPSSGYGRSQLCPDVEEDQELRTLHLDQPTSGFVVSYQMRLGSTIPQAKVHLNVKHICPSDAHVPRAIAAYYYELGTRTLLVHIRP
jgi:hypothetical protein